MSILRVREKINRWGKAVTSRDVFVPLVIILVGAIAFGLGRLSAQTENREPVRVTGPSVGAVAGAAFSRPDASAQASLEETTEARGTESGSVVGSKNGTKYHFPWCSGAKRISPQNLVTFSSAEEARGAGYKPAANCKGLR